MSGLFIFVGLFTVFAPHLNANAAEAPRAFEFDQREIDGKTRSGKILLCRQIGQVYSDCQEWDGNMYVQYAPKQYLLRLKTELTIAAEALKTKFSGKYFDFNTGNEQDGSGASCEINLPSAKLERKIKAGTEFSIVGRGPVTASHLYADNNIYVGYAAKMFLEFQSVKTGIKYPGHCMFAGEISGIDSLLRELAKESSTIELETNF